MNCLKAIALFFAVISFCGFANSAFVNDNLNLLSAKNKIALEKTLSDFFKKFPENKIKVVMQSFQEMPTPETLKLYYEKFDLKTGKTAQLNALIILVQDKKSITVKTPAQYINQKELSSLGKGLSKNFNLAAKEFTSNLLKFLEEKALKKSCEIPTGCKAGEMELIAEVSAYPESFGLLTAAGLPSNHVLGITATKKNDKTIPWNKTLVRIPEFEQFINNCKLDSKCGITLGKWKNGLKFKTFGNIDTGGYKQKNLKIPWIDIMVANKRMGIEWGRKNTKACIAILGIKASDVLKKRAWQK